MYGSSVAYGLHKRAHTSRTQRTSPSNPKPTRPKNKEHCSLPSLSLFAHLKPLEYAALGHIRLVGAPRCQQIPKPAVGRVALRTGGKLSFVLDGVVGHSFQIPATIVFSPLFLACWCMLWSCRSKSDSDKQDQRQKHGRRSSALSIPLGPTARQVDAPSKAQREGIPCMYLYFTIPCVGPRSPLGSPDRFVPVGVKRRFSTFHRVQKPDSRVVVVLFLLLGTKNVKSLIPRFFFLPHVDFMRNGV